VFKYLGKTFNEKVTDKAHDEEGKKCSGMCLGNRREKVIFRRGMMMLESILMYGAEIWG
jgi:hypothetical protein